MVHHLFPSVHFFLFLFLVVHAVWVVLSLSLQLHDLFASKVIRVQYIAIFVDVLLLEHHQLLLSELLLLFSVVVLAFLLLFIAFCHLLYLLGHHLLLLLIHFIFISVLVFIFVVLAVVVVPHHLLHLLVGLGNLVIFVSILFLLNLHLHLLVIFFKLFFSVSFLELVFVLVVIHDLMLALTIYSDLVLTLSWVHFILFFVLLSLISEIVFLVHVHLTT